MGLLILQAIQFVDIPVMSSYLVLIALIFVIINLIVDLLYYIVDSLFLLEIRPEGCGRKGWVFCPKSSLTQFWIEGVPEPVTEKVDGKDQDPGPCRQPSR